jgi:diguanylate cyclase (GGDEF)-like protein
MFVLINCYADQQALDKNLLSKAKESQKEFSLTLQMTYRNMMQMALYISQNEDLNQLFLQGKKAVEAEGGGKGGAKAQQARTALLKKVKPAWDRLTSAFDIRQLHYHLGPGSLSFLRVHKPQKYGDKMDKLRFIIVDTNHEKTPRHGLETGRIYSGLRGVYPVFTIDPNTKKEVYVGALETGTSFKQILPAFAKFFDTEVAVFLTKEHVQSKMWPEFLKNYFAKNPSAQYYLEGSSSKNARSILKQLNISADFQAKSAQIIKRNGRYWSVYYFPLRDYLGNKNKNTPHSGFILMWENISELMTTFHNTIYINLLYALIAFIIIESFLIFFFLREKRLLLAEHEARFDGLTNALNRRQFDRLYEEEFTKSGKANSCLSLILIDIDYFKNYNDLYGHLAGDECLRQLSHSIKELLKRRADFFARYGGEEFIIILPETSIEKAQQLAQKICSNIAEKAIVIPGSDKTVNITISAGVATKELHDSWDSLLKRADKNLYQAKRNGRNQVVAN